MSDYDLKHLEEAYRKASPEERLQILRYEILGRICTVRGHASLLNKIHEINGTNLSEDIQLSVNKVTQASDEILEILNALTKHSE